MGSFGPGAGDSKHELPRRGCGDGLGLVEQGGDSRRRESVNNLSVFCICACESTSKRFFLLLVDSQWILIGDYAGCYASSSIECCLKVKVAFCSSRCCCVGRKVSGGIDRS